MDLSGTTTWNGNDNAFLPEGKKSHVKRATWKRKGERANIDVALKKSYYTNLNAYTFWEFCRYNDLKSVQGKLIPKLHFILRDEGKLMLGLELVKPLHREESKRLDVLYEELKATGWVQRDRSFFDRYDNFVTMQNEDGSQRLVVTDLESFIPWFQEKRESNNKPHVASVIANREIRFLGIPEISPTELEIPGSDKDFEWTCNGLPFQSSWFGKNVVVVPSRSDDLFTTLARLKSIRVKDKPYPRPLFLARERSGIILLGFEHRCISSKPILNEIMTDFFYFLSWSSQRKLRDLFGSGDDDNDEDNSNDEDIIEENVVEKENLEEDKEKENESLVDEQITLERDYEKKKQLLRRSARISSLREKNTSKDNIGFLFSPRIAALKAKKAKDDTRIGGKKKRKKNYHEKEEKAPATKKGRREHGRSVNFRQRNC